MNSNHNPYDFIVNSGASPKKGLLGSFNKQQRLLVLVAGLTIVFIVFITVVMSFFGGSGINKEQTAALARQHAEIIKLASVGSEKALNIETRSFATSVQLSLQSSQQRLNTVVGTEKDKDSALGKNEETDKALAQAEQSNRFDEVFTKMLSDALVAYQRDLKNVYDNTDSAKDKQVLTDIFNDVTALIPKTT